MHNYVKLNIDACFDADSLMGTFGAVLRNSKGDFVVAANNKVETCLDALLVESMTLRFGLHLA